MMQHDFAHSPVAQDYGSLLGTPFKVFLENGVNEKADNITGKIVTDIVDLPGLIASILQSRVLHPRKLSGEDLKFIRSALRMKSTEIADTLDVSLEHYSRCEGGTKTLSSSAEKFFRMYIFLKAASMDMAIQEKLSERKQKNIQCAPEEAKEAIEAFQRVFFEMKIQHLVPAGEELGFSFCRGRTQECSDCGGDEDKWLKRAA